MVRKMSIALSALGLVCIAAARPAPAAAQQIITCQSYENRTTHCSVNTSGGVRLVRQLSDASCARGRSWGTDRNGIWVSRGCRAQFEVGGRRRYDDRDRGRDRRDDWDRGGDRDRRNDSAVRAQAERVCRDAVRRRIGGSRSRGLDVDYAGRDRRGVSVVRWRADRASGQCRVSRDNRLVDFDRYR